MKGDGVALVLEYRNTRAEARAHYELISGDAFRVSRLAHYQSLALWIGVLLLGSYAAYKADMIFLMCALLAVGGITLVRSLRYSRMYWTAVEQSLAARPDLEIKLEVHEDGLHETVEGIRSFVPWSSVKRFTLYRDTLFIELAAGLWAIIPRGSVKNGPTALDDLTRELRERGIEEHPASAKQGGRGKEQPHA